MNIYLITNKYNKNVNIQHTNRSKSVNSLPINKVSIPQQTK